MDFDSRAFRNTLGRFPTGVAVITSGEPGMEYGMTCQSFSSLSLDPPLVVVCIDNEAGMLPILLQTAAFTINILSEHQEGESAFFATKSRPTPPHQFDDLEYEAGETGTARIVGATTVFDCSVHDVFDGGDHKIIVGRVQAFAETSDDAPLLFFQGKYRTLAAAPKEAID